MEDEEIRAEKVEASETWRMLKSWHDGWREGLWESESGLERNDEHRVHRFCYKMEGRAWSEGDSPKEEEKKEVMRVRPFSDCAAFVE